MYIPKTKFCKNQISANTLVDGSVNLNETLLSLNLNPTDLYDVMLVLYVSRFFYLKALKLQTLKIVCGRPSFHVFHL